MSYGAWRHRLDVEQMRRAVYSAVVRAEERRRLRDEGLPLPEPTERQRIEDRLLAMVLAARSGGPRRKGHLGVVAPLPGVASVGQAGVDENRAMVFGDQPPSTVERQSGERPTNDDKEKPPCL